MLVLSWKDDDYQGPSTSRADVYNSFCQTLLDHVTAKTSDEAFRCIDEYKEDLAKLGELAWQALLNDCLYFKLSNMPQDIRLFLEKFISFGFLQPSNLLNSPRPLKLAFFLHKSVQEFLSASFLVRDLKNAKETFNSLSKVDSIKRFKELLEVFKFVSELSSEAAVAVFRHLKMIGEKDGLTDYNFGEKPSIEELTEEQEEFYYISLGLFLSCPASERQAVYSSFLQSVNGVIMMNVHQKHLPTVVKEHCLRSTSFLKPDCVFFFKDRPSRQAVYSSFLQSVNGVIMMNVHQKHLPTVVKEHCLRSTSFLKPDCVFFFKDRPSRISISEVERAQMFSVMSDLDTVVVTCYGDVKSVNMYHVPDPDEFFIKNVGHRLVFCRTRLELIEQLRPLISAPKSSLQEPDHVSQNHDVSSSLHLIEKTSDKTLTHSLSYLREITIQGPTSELVSLMNNLHHVPQLSELTLFQVGMGNQECHLLATNLKYVGELRLLRLSRDPLGHGISELAKHLHSVLHLEKFYLLDTQMGEEGVAALAHSLKHVTRLSELDLSCNPLGHGISELAKHLHSVPYLKQLNLDETKMGEEGVTALAHSLKYVTRLRELDLSYNSLGHGVSEVAKHLQSVPHLKELHLRDTQMGEEEVTALAHSLKYVTQLSDLDLSKNPLGHGISVLAEQLHSVSYLTRLKLNDTKMGQEGVIALAHSLKYVARVSELHLSDNPLGHGISELATHLHSVPYLEQLYLDDTQMGEDEVTALAHELVYVPELAFLWLRKNQLGHGVTELIKCFRSSPQLPVLHLTEVQLTKKEATELCTLANERNMNFASDYHVSCCFVICFNFIFQLLMLVIPRNFLVDEMKPYFKGAVSPFLSTVDSR